MLPLVCQQAAKSFGLAALAGSQASGVAGFLEVHALAHAEPAILSSALANLPCCPVSHFLPRKCVVVPANKLFPERSKRGLDPVARHPASVRLRHVFFGDVRPVWRWTWI